MVQDLKMETDTIKKSQMEATLKVENLGKIWEGYRWQVSPTEYKR